MKKIIIPIIFLFLISLFIIPNNVSAYTGTITYNPTTNIITVIGGTTSNPVTFEDIYQADIANGWGKIIKQNTNFLIYSKINFGDGTTETYFNDTYKQINFNSGILTANAQYLMKVFRLATVTFGLPVYGLENGYAGCQFISTQSYYGNFIICDGFYNFEYGSWVYKTYDDIKIYLFGCSFKGYNSELWVQGFNIFDCQFDSTAYLHTSIHWSGAKINNIISSRTTALVRRPWEDMTYNNIFGTTSAYGYGVWFQGASGTIKNIQCSKYYKSIVMSNVVSDCHMVNCIFNNGWIILWDGTNTGKIYREYEFDLIVLNGEITDFVEGETVTLSKNDIILGTWTTNETGQIPTQTLTYGYYQQSTGDTLQDGEYPFLLTISDNTGLYNDYISRFYVTEKTLITISMQDKDNTMISIEESNNNTIGVIIIIIGICITILIILKKDKII